MTEKQEHFVCEYLKTGNATKAAIRAGYSEKTAYSIGQRLLNNVEIRTLIMKHREKVSEATDITVSQIVKEIRLISRQGKEETTRLKAYDMLMKHLGGYVNELRIIESLSDERINELCNEIIQRFENNGKQERIN